MRFLSAACLLVLVFGVRFLSFFLSLLFPCGKRKKRAVFHSEPGRFSASNFLVFVSSAAELRVSVFLVSMCVCLFRCFRFSLPSISSDERRYKAFGLLVLLGSTHYCDYTCSLSRSSSATSLIRISHLGAGFALRCFQRLSFPHSATRRCHWRDNRYTGGASGTVLSY